ncbi:MAG: signal recognition particle protein Srp19 [Methanomethylovorans sp.]|jgi:signal recognition particle subunit SRP19|uniref:signal recognition particle protein Srp19 n=1 Tax=Methanomethylovorans sp. TaxID=2758717 RepID=UPI0009D3CA94|nr:MAG: Signal recognition particle 19 kDa protein [Methanomethylovorans sp. PtaU1.Bin073]
MRDKNKLVIWPVYIDRNRSRSEGRIISKKSSVAEPTLVEIEKAALKLGLNPEVEKDKSYPRSWWEKSGRVLIDNSAPKTQLSRKIATAIKEIRSE